MSTTENTIEREVRGLTAADGSLEDPLPTTEAEAE